MYYHISPVCRYFVRGGCRNGSHCRYRHPHEQAKSLVVSEHVKLRIEFLNFGTIKTSTYTPWNRKQCLCALKSKVFCEFQKQSRSSAIRILATGLLKWNLCTQAEIRDLVVLGLLMPLDVFVGYVNLLR